MKIVTRNWLLTLALLVLYSGLTFAGAVEDEVSQAEEARYAAMIAQDKAALAQILADEFVYHQPTGKVQNKPGYIEQVTTGDVKVKKATRYDYQTHAYGNTATVQGSTKVDLEIKGEPKVFDLYFLNVWVKRDGRWQIVARQSAFKPK
ncbi:MAG TPA: nuclear transport factor 2 family protein [Burkholderiales bacterium]|nr:nuclear transport factor 2 family protein [Burkholderiales bacterium]